MSWKIRCKRKFKIVRVRALYYKKIKKKKNHKNSINNKNPKIIYCMEKTKKCKLFKSK